jgi:hypothetical protein
MPLRKDIWRPAIVEAPLHEIVARGSIEGFARHWLPPMGSFCFLADPFGFWHNGRLYVFVEAYDYRDRIGTIEVCVYDDHYRLLDQRPVLIEPWHLSYPFVFEAEGDIWMLPEGHKSGRLTLYRAVEFPFRWEAAAVIALDGLAVDATPYFHDGLWWLFYAAADHETDKMAALHIAYAERLRGPWHAHPANPVRVDRSGARPGGTPIAIDGTIILPVQDCSHTYGGAIRPLRIDALTPDVFSATLGEPIRAPADAAPFTEGLHTLAAAGDVTLIDVKRTILSLHGLAIQASERLRREIRKRR